MKTDEEREDCSVCGGYVEDGNGDAIDCECVDCEHEWVVECCDNGVGHTWYEVECKHCGADISEDEWADIQGGE